MTLNRQDLADLKELIEFMAWPLGKLNFFNKTESHQICSLVETAGNAPVSAESTTMPVTTPSSPPPDHQDNKIYPDLSNFEENSHIDEGNDCEDPVSSGKGLS